MWLEIIDIQVLWRTGAPCEWFCGGNKYLFILNVDVRLVRALRRSKVYSEVRNILTTGKKRNSQIGQPSESKKYFDFKSEYLGGGIEKVVDGGGGPAVVERWVEQPQPPPRPPPPCSCAACCNSPGESWNGGWAPPPSRPSCGPSPLGPGGGPPSLSGGPGGPMSTPTPLPSSHSPLPNGPHSLMGPPSTPGPPPVPHVSGSGSRGGGEPFYCGPPPSAPAAYYRFILSVLQLDCIHQIHS